MLEDGLNGNGTAFSCTKYDFTWRNVDSESVQTPLLNAILKHCGGRFPHGARPSDGAEARTAHSYANIFDRLKMGNLGDQDLVRPKQKLEEFWTGGLREAYETHGEDLPAGLADPICKSTFMSRDDFFAVLKIMAAKANAKDAEALLADSLKTSGVEDKVLDYVKNIQNLASGKAGGVVVDDLRETLKRLGHKGLDKRGNRPRLLKLLWDLKVSTLESPDSSDEEGGETLDEMRKRKAKEKLDADLDNLDAAECVANALLQEQTQPTDELVQCARADEAAVRGADDVTERRADQRLPPLAAEYVRPQRVRRAPKFGYDKFLRK